MLTVAVNWVYRLVQNSRYHEETSDAGIVRSALRAPLARDRIHIIKYVVGPTAFLVKAERGL